MTAGRQRIWEKRHENICHHIGFCCGVSMRNPKEPQFVEIESDIQVFTLSVNSIDENNEFQKEFNLIGHGNLHILSATPEIFEEYSIIGTPTFVAIDGKGVIVGTGSVGTLKQIVELTNEIR